MYVLYLLNKSAVYSFMRQKTKNMENYLISNYRGDCEERVCSCCGEKYLTNINRTRCSQKCATKMKNKRYKENSIFRPKYEKERLSIIRTNIFGYVTRINK